MLIQILISVLHVLIDSLFQHFHVFLFHQLVMDIIQAMDGVLLVIPILYSNLMDHVPQRFNLMDQLPLLILKIAKQHHHPKFQQHTQTIKDKEGLKTLDQQINQTVKEQSLQLAPILVKNLI